MAYPSTITPGGNAIHLFGLMISTNSSSLNYEDKSYCVYSLEVVNTGCSQSLIKEETTSPPEEPTP